MNISQYIYMIILEWQDTMKRVTAAADAGGCGWETRLLGIHSAVGRLGTGDDGEVGQLANKGG